MPLPLISARLPSELNRFMTTSMWSASLIGRAPWISPSAPMPVRRSHNRRASSPSTVRARSFDLVENDEEVVGQAVMFGEPHRVSLPGARRDGREHCLQEHCLQTRLCPGAGVDPLDAGISAEPALLAASELLRAGDGQLHCLVEARLAIEMRQQLLVAQGLAGGAGETPRADRASVSTSRQEARRPSGLGTGP